MNRSILIVICDFLLVSLLVFSSPDVNRVTSDPASRSIKMEMPTNAPDANQDLANAMRVALTEEQKTRNQLQTELANARSSVAQQTAAQQAAAQQAAALNQRLTEREQQVQAFQQKLQSQEEAARALEQQRTALQEQFAAAQTNIETLTGQLQNTSTESQASKEKLAALEAQLRKQAEQAAALQAQMSQLAQSNAAAALERQELSTQLRVAEVEKKSAAEQAARMTEEVKTEREEKARLAEGVKVLANKSSELAQEVRENRPLAPNTIFNDLASNRIAASFTVSRPGLFGASEKRKDTQTVLVSDGTNTFALCHLQDTPLTLFNPGIDWQVLAGSLSGGMTILPMRAMSFDDRDPRVVLVPVTAGEARQLGSKVYRISTDPFKFQDAVLIGAREGYYGECRFEIDLTTPQYLKLDRNLLKGLFGKFNPSSGDLVFSHTGELLGIMVNGTYCLMIHDLNAGATFQFGDNVYAQHTGQTLARLYTEVMSLPFKLQ